LAIYRLKATAHIALNMQHIPPKRLQISTTVYGVTLQKGRKIDEEERVGEMRKQRIGDDV
jgi:hypothetical protein